MINVTELRPGNFFIDEEQMYQVLDILLNKTAMRKMVAKVKVKNVKSGAVTEISRNSGYMVEPIRLDKSKMQFLYDDGVMMIFMDQNTYEQVEVPVVKLEWEKRFLVPNTEVEIVMYEGEVLGLTLPSKVALQITDCEPAVKGDTVNKAMKNATLETGVTCRVPLFIESGEVILVRTDNGEYDGRA